MRGTMTVSNESADITVVGVAGNGHDVINMKIHQQIITINHGQNDTRVSGTTVIGRQDTTADRCI